MAEITGIIKNNSTKSASISAINTNQKLTRRHTIDGLLGGLFGFLFGQLLGFGIDASFLFVFFSFSLGLGLDESLFCGFSLGNGIEESLFCALSLGLGLETSNLSGLSPGKCLEENGLLLNTLSCLPRLGLSTQRILLQEIITRGPKFTSPSYLANKIF